MALDLDNGAAQASGCARSNKTTSWLLSRNTNTRAMQGIGLPPLLLVNPHIYLPRTLIYHIHMSNSSPSTHMCSSALAGDAAATEIVAFADHHWPMLPCCLLQLLYCFNLLYSFQLLYCLHPFEAVGALLVLPVWHALQPIPPCSISGGLLFCWCCIAAWLYDCLCCS